MKWWGKREGDKMVLLQVPVAARVGEAAGELVERPPLVEEPAAVAERPSAPVKTPSVAAAGRPVDEAERRAEAESAAETPRAPVNPLGEVAARPVDEAGRGPAAMPDGVRLLPRVFYRAF